MKYLYICLLVGLAGCSSLGLGRGEAAELHVFVLNQCSGVATIEDAYQWDTARNEAERRQLVNKFMVQELEQGSVPVKKRLVGAEWSYGEYISFCDRDGQLVVLSWGR